ncbi:MAG TPA: [protein-PII] uridylyltransferase [Nakamurella sp.]
MPNSPVGMAGGFAELRAQLLSRTGLPGPARRRALARLTDGWLSELAQEAGVNVGGVALVAVGGYGRGELSPFSDLDLVLLHSTETPASYAGMLAERLWYPIWDSKIRLDHSVRSVGGARQVGRTDLPAMLGMLDLRHIAGDPELAVTLHRRVLADWRADAKSRLEALRVSCQERASRSGEMAFATTPDLKESRGGLRDLVVMRAVAASWVADCPHQGLEEARSALLDVRDVVQTLAGRSTDRLQVQDQDAVAQTLGLDDRDVLLRHVAGIARTVDHASDLTWHRVDRALSRPQGTITDLGGRLVRRTDRTPLADGVVEQEGEAVLARAVNSATDATLVIRAAAAAAQAGLPVSPATVLRLAKTCPPLPDPWPAAALDAFLALLGAGAPMIAAWEDLDQAGLISTLLPGWERLRSMPQRDPIHLYTVDRHLMETAVVAAGLVRRVSRPDLLLLAAILHDIGKGHGADYPDHSVAGAEISVRWLTRMGVAKPDIELISTLIRHHLLIAESASRRDPDDPTTISMIVAAVGDVTTLDLLSALTEADARSAGPAAWTTWRAGQINHLVSRVRRALAGEPPAQPPAITEVERQLIANGGVGIVIEQIPGALRVTIAAPDRPGLLAASAAVLTMHRLTVRTAAVRTIDGTGLQNWTVAPQFGDAPAAATLRADLIRALDGSLDVAARLARRSAPNRRGPAAPPEVLVIDGASESSSVLEVRAHDLPGMLYTVSSALTTLDVSVVSARVHTLGADAVDVFYVQAADGSPLSPARAREVAAAVAQALV